MAHEIVKESLPAPTDKMRRRADKGRAVANYFGFTGMPSDDEPIRRRHDYLWGPLKIGVAAVAGAAITLGGAKWVIDENQEYRTAMAANDLLTSGRVKVNMPFILARRNIRERPYADYGEGSTICGFYPSPQAIPPNEIQPVEGRSGWYEISGESREAVEGCGGMFGLGFSRPETVFVHEENIASPQ
jgi:hypothetical protein